MSSLIFTNISTSLLKCKVTKKNPHYPTLYSHFLMSLKKIFKKLFLNGCNGRQCKVRLTIYKKKQNAARSFFLEEHDNSKSIIPSDNSPATRIKQQNQLFQITVETLPLPLFMTYVLDEDASQSGAVGTPDVGEHLVAYHNHLLFGAAKQVERPEKTIGIRLAGFSHKQRVNIFHEAADAFFTVVGKENRFESDAMQTAEQIINFGGGVSAMRHKRVVNIENQSPAALVEELLIVDGEDILHVRRRKKYGFQGRLL